MILFKTGFLILDFFTIVILTAFFIGLTSQFSILLTAGLILVFAGFFYETRKNWSRLNMKRAEMRDYFSIIDFNNFLAVVLGGLVTFALSQFFGISAVLASGLIGIIAYLLIPKYEVPAFCGSFVGMASYSLLPGYRYLILAGFIAGIVYVIGKYSFKGFGGKLGTTAFIGTVLAAVFTGQNFTGGSIPEGNMIYLLIFYSIIGAVLTFIMHTRFKFSVVFSSGFIGVIAAIILPIIYPVNGATLAVMAYCASFAGMSSKDRIPNELIMTLAAILTALIFIFTSPYLNGAGGKLGITAFASIITIKGLAIIFNKTVSSGIIPEKYQLSESNQSS
ncbi:MAG: hypothetical protein ACQEQP_05755 [Bacillota bacterium]